MTATEVKRRYEAGCIEAGQWLVPIQKQWESWVLEKLEPITPPPQPAPKGQESVSG